MLRMFCTQSLPVLQNDQKTLYNIAPLSSAWLIPMCVILSHRNSYICKYLASEDILDSNMTVESQIKLWGNNIFHSWRLESLCYWAQQSKAAERVLDTQLQPFKTKPVYNFLATVYSFLGRGLPNVCFMVVKSIICVHIIICRHTPGQESTAHSLE